MKLFLDCEFTQLNEDTKLISLALVSEGGDEFYVELTDTYQVEDCSEFVLENVLPQLDLPEHGKTMAEAQELLLAFLGNLNGNLEICSDAPEWDWDFFCQLAYVDHRWPSNVTNQATNLIRLFRELEADDIGDMTIPELPHHALLDALLLASLYRELAPTLKQ
ncbi:3'-5' exoribonuclease [Pseudomonas sp. CFBP 8770]|uniref:3'-5' exoribonuclease n=1 Tax=unclassified Pseudomonas TaxID=196821 RepID=UPI00178689B2|nr:MULTISPECIES: 3'-5' exoribonuclease [unclassified Pseudomonas]MBD8473219.1 3'-5' exoribonuclease [Pseudomonas sp. CFBP 8773]MBD8646346.1 3'-5' exoribonuclease [Pseudomonas sp. CFBP 8770]